MCLSKHLSKFLYFVFWGKGKIIAGETSQFYHRNFIIAVLSSQIYHRSFIIANLSSKYYHRSHIITVLSLQLYHSNTFLSFHHSFITYAMAGKYVLNKFFKIILQHPLEQFFSTGRSRPTFVLWALSFGPPKPVF